MPIDVTKCHSDASQGSGVDQAGRAASPWMTPAKAAVYLGIALGTLRNWTSARYIPHAKKGRVVRYNRRAVDTWLARGGCTGRATLADV
jgi:excisionase family DNA binding protein